MNEEMQYRPPTLNDLREYGYIWKIMSDDEIIEMYIQLSKNNEMRWEKMRFYP